ncbi:hypothetical protein TanjilG_06026 [Lupinus angustifolius]|uniref:Uncharacterized protein n=1 Tax=Lupinus angustifolius TaxID=3871 RepID=A0A4P1RJB9_LUPAN|nr:hypothetical protein TanjilG_06026 [Lupinus angustifolius]
MVLRRMMSQNHDPTSMEKRAKQSCSGEQELDKYKLIHEESSEIGCMIEQACTRHKWMHHFQQLSSNMVHHNFTNIEQHHPLDLSDNNQSVMLIQFAKVTQVNTLQILDKEQDSISSSYYNIHKSRLESSNVGPIKAFVA